MLKVFCGRLASCAQGSGRAQPKPQFQQNTTSMKRGFKPPLNSIPLRLHMISVIQGTDCDCNGGSFSSLRLALDGQVSFPSCGAFSGKPRRAAAPKEART